MILIKFLKGQMVRSISNFPSMPPFVTMASKEACLCPRLLLAASRYCVGWEKKRPDRRRQLPLVLHTEGYGSLGGTIQMNKLCIHIFVCPLLTEAGCLYILFWPGVTLGLWLVRLGQGRQILVKNKLDEELSAADHCSTAGARLPTRHTALLIRLPMSPSMRQTLSIVSQGPVGGVGHARAGTVW